MPHDRILKCIRSCSCGALKTWKFPRYFFSFSALHLCFAPAVGMGKSVPEVHATLFSVSPNSSLHSSLLIQCSILRISTSNVVVYHTCVSSSNFQLCAIKICNSTFAWICQLAKSAIPIKIATAAATTAAPRSAHRLNVAICSRGFLGFVFPWVFWYSQGGNYSWAKRISRTVVRNPTDSSHNRAHTSSCQTENLREVSFRGTSFVMVVEMKSSKTSAYLSLHLRLCFMNLYGQ